MQPVKDSWNITVVGSWNVAILGPGWLAEHVFADNELTIEFPTNPGYSPRYSAGNVTVVASPGRIVVIPKVLTARTLNNAFKAANRLLEKLPHTPVSAIGVNFGFIQEAADDDLLSHVPEVDGPLFADAGFEITTRRLAWQLLVDDLRLNLTVSEGSGNIAFDFNFDQPIVNCGGGMSFLQPGLSRFRDAATKVLAGVYGLEWEEQ